MAWGNFKQCNVLVLLLLIPVSIRTKGTHIRDNKVAIGTKKLMRGNKNRNFVHITDSSVDFGVLALALDL